MKKLMAANWKMYKTWDEARDTAKAMVRLLANSMPKDREVLLIPPFTAIRGVYDTIRDAKGFYVGGQDLYPASEGAYTGEISPGMLLDVGCCFALAGHSERRHVLGESNELIGKKVAFGLDSGLSMILCVGETVEERKEGKLTEVVLKQLRAGLATAARGFDPEMLVIAYEPVWAIGTGLVAGPKEILEAHKLIRKELLAMFPDIGSEIRILYGGSVKADNCGEIIALDNVDGVLVGGASLKADSFSLIVTA